MSEPDRHQDVWELLPWYVNGTLQARDTDLVSAHLSACTACHDEVARCRALAAAVRSTTDVAWAPSAQRLERVLASIDAIEAAGARQRTWRERLGAPIELLRELFQGTPRPMRWALATQAALVVLLVGVATWQGVFSSRAPYRTLADSDEARRAQTLIHVVFAEDITEREIRTLLGRARGKIIGGPSAIGVYTVDVGASTPDRETPALQILRGDPKVRLAEPIQKR